MTTTVDTHQDGRNGADLVARSRRGDRDAWPDLVARFAPYVHAIAVRRYRLSEQDGEDVFQEVFLRAWTQIDTLRDDAAIRPWLGQLTRRLAIDRIRARTREAARDDLDTLHHVPSGDLLAGLDESLTVRDAIERMPGIHRDVVDRFVEGQSHAKIAADLGIAEGTVASRIARARERLRMKLTS